ncbi:MAG: fumarylacetoacetate hydrolase family protein [Deltaproteobacteria bacterium]|nr:fumarylacetoacetate hydrolase family protein [Deltaproteobacteria bacterium]
MRLYTYQVSTRIGVFERIGVELDGGIVDLNLACATYAEESQEPNPHAYASFHVPPYMVKYLEGGERSKKVAVESLEFVRDRLAKKGKIAGPNGEQIVYSFDEIKLMAPVPRPNIVRDCMVFLEHFRERWEQKGWRVPEVFYKWPCYATQSGAVVAGTGDPILMPRYTEQLDFELEMGIYIGKRGIDIPEGNAEDYIAGFTVFNDVSARDVQYEEMQMRLGPAKGKNFEHGSIMGPCMVTPDEIDYNNLRMIARVNGEVVADDNSRDMYHKFPTIVARISEDEYLYPGDFIASGTSPCGTTHASKLGRWLQPGDVVELEIEGIGVIRNEVVKKSS